MSSWTSRQRKRWHSQQSGFNCFAQTYALNRASSNIEIIGELDDHLETKLSDLWCLLKLQAGGEDGALQTNAAPNIFFYA
jgi:hypothetical protein